MTKLIVILIISLCLAILNVWIDTKRKKKEKDDE